MNALLLSLAFQAPLPPISEVLEHVRATHSSPYTVEAELRIVTTWTKEYSRFWGDNGPERQHSEIERHRWTGHYPMFTDRLLSSTVLYGGNSFYVAYCFDGKKARYLTTRGKEVTEDGASTLVNPESYLHEIGATPLTEAISDYAKVVGWVQNPTFGQCLRLSAEIYEGEPINFDVAPSYDWVLVKISNLRKDIPLLTEWEVLKLVKGNGVYYCSEAVKTETHLTKRGPQVLKKAKMFAKDFGVHPFTSEEFADPKRLGPTSVSKPPK